VTDELRAYERRLRDEFGLVFARRYVSQVVDELGEDAGAFWLAAACRVFKRNASPRRLARWSYGKQSKLHLLPSDVTYLRGLGEVRAEVNGDLGWLMLRAWLATDPRKAEALRREVERERQS
jgi:hypothetical protein